jgi:uncharacterized protein YecE (DUF72 family)
MAKGSTGTAVRVLAGASGFSYKPWRGKFYPEDLPDSEMLAWYAGKLPTVEINNTFYQMPRSTVLAAWAERTPPSFRFALKASQRITHKQRLKDAAESVGYFFKAAEALGDKLGPTLFQLPPYMRKDLPLLEEFLTLLPEGRRAAFEFRHASWADDEVHEVLRKHGAALCVADTDELESDPDVVPTADWGYLRLRRSGYADGALRSWAERIGSQPWSEAYVFFKHEDEGAAPKMALQLLELAGTSAGPG